MSTTVRERAEIEQQFKWNTESVFADKAAWEAEVEAIGKDLPAVAAQQGHLHEDPTALADFLAQWAGQGCLDGTVYRSHRLRRGPGVCWGVPEEPSSAEYRPFGGPYGAAAHDRHSGSGDDGRPDIR